MSAKNALIALVAIIILNGALKLGQLWVSDLQTRCVAQGGQVIEMVSRLQVGCLLPVGMTRLDPENP